MADMSDRCERCNGHGTLHKCVRCGVVYCYIHKYSDCDSPGCDGERSETIPCPDCTEPDTATKQGEAQ